MKKVVLFIGILFVTFGYTSAQNTATSARPTVIQAIESSDAAGSKITINQDNRIDNLINTYISREIKLTGPYSGPGYRVQVFSSNAQKTAKNEALSIERQLRSAFPEQAVYSIYASPFWKVRIGNFRTLAEAQNFRSELIKAFPNLRQEAYTVRESRIKID